ncbi:hypothetical protein ACE193_10675 [Bernardetia sp. OM2101]|uniref:hypothetical protein n=1 Tax=Bernardetia sp. OM2101 TaxID=3344876 RepID=UPI0035D0CE2F
MKYLLLFIFFISCRASTVEVVNYKYKRNKKSPTFYMSIPREYEVSYLSGNHEYTQQYLYNDSALLYITTFSNTPNYPQTRKENYYYERFYAILNKDTLCISGIDSLGKYWKDSLLSNGTTLGYSKVSEERKVDFDKALSSFRSKRTEK